MEIKLSTKRKIKLKDVSLDIKDELLDSVEYVLDTKGSIENIKMPQTTITKFIRATLSGGDFKDYKEVKGVPSDDVLKQLTFEERTEIFLKIQESLLLGEEKPSD